MRPTFSLFCSINFAYFLAVLFCFVLLPTLKEKIESPLRANDHTLSLVAFRSLVAEIEQENSISIAETSSKPDAEERHTFLVHGKGCSIPAYSPFHSEVAKYLETKAITCRKRSYAFTTGNILHINKTALAEAYGLKTNDVVCTLCEIVRFTRNDNRIYCNTLLSNFVEKYESRSDFLKVHCTVPKKAWYESPSLPGVLYEDFFAFINIKQKVEKRCQKAWKSLHFENELPDPEYLSVLMIGLDSMSRLSFLRSMPQSYGYLKRHMEAIELQGYNKLGENTFPCVTPLLTGKFEEELGSPMGPYDSEPWIWNEFSKNGYRTLLAEDSPRISTFNHKARGFTHQPTDFYLRPLYLSAERSAMRKGKTNLHCFNSRLEVNVILDWLYEFGRVFRGKPYFAYTFITRLFHGMFNEPHNADPFLKNFFLRATREGLLNNTVVVLFSDHGIRAANFSSTPAGRHEDRLPLFLMAFPKWFYAKYPKIHQNLKTNQNRLTTLFDVHELLKDILLISGGILKKTSLPRGTSLFREIPKDRTCEDAAVRPQWCTCRPYFEIHTDKKYVRTSAEALVAKINSITRNVRNICALLTLRNILWARIYMDGTDWLWLQIGFETLPGNSIFEGIAKFNTRTNESLTTTSDFSRMNEYGLQSQCVRSKYLVKYCYCV